MYPDTDDESGVVIVWWFLMSGYLVSRFMDWLYYKLCFLTGGLYLVYRQNSVKFLIDFRMLEYFRNRISNRSCWDSLFFRLAVILRCRPSGRGMTNMLLVILNDNDYRDLNVSNISNYSFSTRVKISLFEIIYQNYYFWSVNVQNMQKL